MPRLIVTRDDYFALALDILATEGHPGLRIGSLCRRAGVTAGSFYHHFRGMDAFVNALLDHWERQKTQVLLALAASEPDVDTRIHRLQELALDLPHGAETAIRAWSHVNPAVAEVQHRVDAQRHAAVLDAIRALVAEDDEARALAAMAMSILIGFQQWHVPADSQELAALLTLFETMLRDRAGVRAG